MRKKTEEKILDVDASMQGSLVFKDPVNMRINGRFEGSLDTKGSLTIGENAVVKANIKGETVIIAGEVTGNIDATNSLKLIPPAQVIGDISAPTLNIAEGAILQGHCQMLSSSRVGDYLSVDEVARYLDVDTSLISNWANAGKLPAVKERDTWRFERSKIDQWVANERVK